MKWSATGDKVLLKRKALEMHGQKEWPDWPFWLYWPYWTDFLRARSRTRTRFSPFASSCTGNGYRYAVYDLTVKREMKTNRTSIRLWRKLVRVFLPCFPCGLWLKKKLVFCDKCGECTSPQQHRTTTTLITKQNAELRLKYQTNIDLTSALYSINVINHQHDGIGRICNKHWKKV
jgi:hypothetical protein